MKTAMILANLGGFDKHHAWEKQTADVYRLTDDTFPKRKCLSARYSRFQAKIPKLFSWQMYPGYDVYIWVDASFKVLSGAAEWLCSKLDGADAVFFIHPHRRSIRQEYDFMRENGVHWSIRQRYGGDFIDEQYKIISDDDSYVDNLLVCGGVFAYRNTTKMQEMLKDWWYFISRYSLNDQLSLPYVIRKHGVDINVIIENIYKAPYFKFMRFHRG